MQVALGRGQDILDEDVSVTVDGIGYGDCYQAVQDLSEVVSISGYFKGDYYCRLLDENPAAVAERLRQFIESEVDNAKGSNI